MKNKAGAWALFVAYILVTIGAINWGLISVFKFDLVQWIGTFTGLWLATTIYFLVGVSGVISLFYIPKMWKQIKN